MLSSRSHFLLCVFVSTLLGELSSLKEFSLARFRTTPYANNSVININLVGEGFEGSQITDGGALECHTDDITCCRGIDNPPNGTGRGEWYYPNGTVVQPPGGGTGFYRTRGHMVLRLNRDVTRTPTGVYTCVIPGAGGVNITRYITLESGLRCNDSLADIINGTVTYTPPRSVSSDLPAGQRYTGTIATYSCSSGYQLVGGSSLRACGPERNWNGTEPSCVAATTIRFSTTLPVPFSVSDSQTTSNKLSSSTVTVPNRNTDISSSNTPEAGGELVIGAVVAVAFITVLIIVGVLTGLIIWRSRVSRRQKSTVTPAKCVQMSDIQPLPEQDPVIVGLRNSEKIESASILEEEKVHLTTKKVVLESCDGNEDSGSGSGKTEREKSVMSESCDGGEGGGSVEASGFGVPVTEFGRVVTNKHATGNKQFAQHYEALDSGERGHMTSVSVTRENKKANRFKNITVYDDNRIVLQPLPGNKDCQSDYINACYIDGFTVPKKFVATQGPLPNTVVDFWRMIWQEKPSAIVMLTNLEEGNKVKCEQYWPESGSKSYGPILVILTEQQIFADYTIRSFIITNTGDGKSLKLTQFHFTAWPDHGVPDYATPVLAFHRRIRSHHTPSMGPLVLHCSAGVGRTGTYITLDNVLDQIEAEGVVDIDGVIVKARNQRMKMVQTKEQYIFIHDAILEFLTCGDTQISSTNLRLELDKLNRVDPSHQCTGYQHQFNVLDQVTPSPTEVNCSTALRNKDKNRGDKYLPVEQFRVVLWGGQPNYIHAVTANGYKHQRAYIIAQNPLKSTVRNFWKVVTDRKCAAIVMLSQLKENKEEACAMYWADEGAQVYGEFDVEFTEKEESIGFTIRKLIVENLKSHQSHQVTQFHVTNWSPDGTCSNLKVITDVIEEVTKVQRRTGNNPILVHCSDTVSRSGMFCAIATTIDRCKTEGVVDVFQVVKALRIHKPGAVLTVEQYKLVHEAIIVFLDSFDTYANFQV